MLNQVGLCQSQPSFKWGFPKKVKLAFNFDEQSLPKAQKFAQTLFFDSAGEVQKYGTPIIHTPKVLITKGDNVRVQVSPVNKREFPDMEKAINKMKRDLQIFPIRVFK